MTTAHVNRIATAVPAHDVHRAFERFVEDLLAGTREEALFRRLARRSGIERRFSTMAPVVDPAGFVTEAGGFYFPGNFPSTARRMQRYAETAPGLAQEAIERLDTDPRAITHLVVASCTGFMAPGLDQVLIERVGMRPDVERTVVGFMGCYAAVNSLRLAHHIVRSDASARVLVVNLEMCTLHFQDTKNLESLLSMMLFGDGASAALVTAEEKGLALEDFLSIAIPESGNLITWDIGDTGFDIGLSGEVPRRIAAAMAQEDVRNAPTGLLRGQRPEHYGWYAVHAGGRAILDAVESGLSLTEDRLSWSRSVLKDFGNMSSATIMFILQRIMAATDGVGERGLAMAFGPGLACETFRFRKL
ncbi:MAG: type III polyketide synthase [Sphingomonadaceae bacterium]